MSNKFTKLAELISFSGIEDGFGIVSPIIIVGDDGKSLYVGAEIDEARLRSEIEEILNFAVVKEIGDFKITGKVNKGISYFKIE